MRLGSSSIFRKETLDVLLHRLYEELLKESLVKKAFIIIEEKYFENGEECTCFKINEIPIETEHLAISRDIECHRLIKKYSFKERLKILLKGKL